MSTRKFFQRPQIALALRARAILLAFETIYSCLFIPNCTRNHVITCTNKKMEKLQIFDQNHGTNPFGKIPIFLLFEIFVSIV